MHSLNANYFLVSKCLEVIILFYLWYCEYLKVRSKLGKYLLNLDEVSFKLVVTVLVRYLIQAFVYFGIYFSTHICTFYFKAIVWGWFSLMFKFIRGQCFENTFSIYLNFFFAMLSSTVIFFFSSFWDGELCIH